MDGFFIKFVDKQYIDGMINGAYFFKNLSYFKNQPDDIDDSGIMDSAEGRYDLLLENSEDSVRISYGVSGVENHIAIMSLVYLRKSDLINNLENGKMKIKSDVIKELRNISNGRPCFIVPCNEILDQIENHDFSGDNVKSCYVGKANYYERGNTNQLLSEMNYDEVIDLYFKKRSTYANQREFRILLETVDEFTDRTIEFKDKLKSIVRYDSFEDLAKFEY